MFRIAALCVYEITDLRGPARPPRPRPLESAI
jgi:hypothetical protein